MVNIFNLYKVELEEKAVTITNPNLRNNEKEIKVTQNNVIIFNDGVYLFTFPGERH